MSQGIRRTACGPIKGTSCQWPGIEAYKGIRYATAERWGYPALVEHWEGTYDGTRYGACCYQPRSFYDEAAVPEKAFYYHEFREGETYTYSEDCLFLNIWTSESAAPGEKRPVIVYIHGGGFVGGCGHEKHFDGPVWPCFGVVAVTIQYRLGPLGFLCLPELAQESGHTGNYGLYDQLAALQWVKKNIEAFGGDPENITLMGQSAGAMSVQQLCISPLAQGLMAKAVMSSGGGVGRELDAPPAQSRYAYWTHVKEQAGCGTLEQLRALSADRLFAAWQETKVRENAPGGLDCSPVTDGALLPHKGTEALAAGEQRRIPYMMGMSSEDIMPPILYDMIQSWCGAQKDSGGQEGAWAWFFDRRLPGDDNGAWHSSDLWYWFGTLAHCWRPFTEKDRLLSEQMVAYLIAFAFTGDPNGEGRPQWKKTGGGEARLLRLGEEETGMGAVDREALVHTMLTNRAVGE